MPQRIAPRRPIKLFLREWREYLELSQQLVGDRFEPPIERGGVSRFERGTRGLSVNVLAAYAEALSRASGRKIPVSALYRPPSDDQSLDELIADAPEDLRKKAREVVNVLVKTAT